MSSNLLLERLDSVPCSQSTSYQSKVKFLHEYRGLIHGQQNFARDLLLPENLTVFGLHSNVFQVFCYLTRCPSLDLFLCVEIPLFFVCFMPCYVGQPLIKMGAIFASRVICHPALCRSPIGSRYLHIRYVLINDTQGLVHHWTLFIWALLNHADAPLGRTACG